MQNISLPSILPDTSTIILHLLREEIRFRKLSRILEQAQIDIEKYAPNLSSLALSLCGFENLSDELFLWYVEKLDQYTEITNADDIDIKKLALSFYVDIQLKSRSQIFRA
jgi:hypothetical protein